MPRRSATSSRLCSESNVVLGELCAIIGPAEKITVYDLETQQSMHEIEFPDESGKFWSVLFADDNTLLAGVLKFGRNPCGIYSWSLKEANGVPKEFKFDGMEYGAAAMDLSADGLTLASGHIGAQLWTLDKREIRKTLPFVGSPASQQGCAALRFSNDGRALATGDLGGRVWVWNRKTWGFRKLGMQDQISSVDFSPQ